jgi:hypothetical protein
LACKVSAEFAASEDGARDADLVGVLKIERNSDVRCGKNPASHVVTHTVNAVNDARQADRELPSPCIGLSNTIRQNRASNAALDT